MRHSKIITVLLFSFFTFYFLLFTFPPQADAADFTTDYNVTYNVGLDGKAKVTQNIALTNNTATLYPADYTLLIKGGEIENAAAQDEFGEMPLEIIKKNKENAIKVSFNKHAVGQGSKVFWTLSYEIPEFAKKRGRIWELTVPKISETPDIGSYTVTLQVPKSFGLEHYISPQPDLIEHTESRWIYSFNQLPFTIYDPPAGGPITMAFGDYQLFSFKIKYHLQNPESFAATTEIALLPDLPAESAGMPPYQKIYYQNLSPSPQKIYKDADGNYMAVYKLATKEKLDIVFEGIAKIEIKRISELENLPAQAGQRIGSLIRYTVPAKYWEVNAVEIQSLLKEIVETNNNLTPKSFATGQAMKQFNNEQNCQMAKWLNCYEPQSLARAIYDYVVTNLQYNSTRTEQEVERLGAVQALNRKDSAVCMEFTDLLITLMRAAGIPAREIDGYAYTAEDKGNSINLDTLHSWAQVWFEDYGWINIDPTWGATTGIDYFSKLDTNHLAFVIKGIDSEKPYPAGSYKIDDLEQGDVKVDFAEKFSSNIIPFQLWWETWEREQKKVDWLTALFHFLSRFF